MDFALRKPVLRRLAIGSALVGALTACGTVAFQHEESRLTFRVVRDTPGWYTGMPDGVQEFVSTDFDPFRPALAGTRFAGARIVTAPRALAAVIGQIGWERLRSGQALDPAAVDANYIRRSDAELSLNP